jgi:hypothetical protein
MTLHRGRRRTVGLLIVCLALTGCARAASVAGTASSLTSSRGSFVATWVPPSLAPTAARGSVARISWQSPTGRKGSVPVIEAIAFSGANHDGAALTLLSASAALLPRGYWTSYLDSSSWVHREEGGRLCLASVPGRTGNAQVVFEQHGYYVQIAGFKVAPADLLRFCGALRYASG